MRRLFGGDRASNQPSFATNPTNVILDINGYFAP